MPLTHTSLLNMRHFLITIVVFTIELDIICDFRRYLDGVVIFFPSLKDLSRWSVHVDLIVEEEELQPVSEILDLIWMFDGIGMILSLILIIAINRSKVAYAAAQTYAIGSEAAFK